MSTVASDRISWSRGLSSLGAIVAATFAVAVLTSSDYPDVIWGWPVTARDQINFPMILLLTAGPVIVAGLLLWRPSPWPSRRASLFWAAWVLYTLFETASAMISVAPLPSLIVYAARDAALGLVFLVVVRSRTDRPLQILAMAIAAVGIVQMLCALAQEVPVVVMLGPAWIVERWTAGADFIELRPQGLTQYPTILGALLVTTLPLVGLAPLRRRTQGFLWVVGAVVVVFSGIRGSVLGMAVGVPVAGLIVATKHSSVWRRALGMGIIVVCLAGAAVGMNSDALASMNENTRAFDATVAWTLTSARPWLGVGSGNFARAARQLPQYATAKERMEPAHNWLLLRLAEGGTLGAALALFLWAGPILWLLFRGEGWRDAVLAAAFVALAATQWFDYEMLYWIGGAVIQVLLFVLWLGPWESSRPGMNHARRAALTADSI